MSSITPSYIEEYIYGLLPRPQGLFREMEAVASREGIPIVGPLVGRFLLVLARSMEAKRILEFGTAIGYSTLWLAEAVAHFGGRVLSVEADNRRAEIAVRNIRRAGREEAVQIVVTEATDFVRGLKEEFDLIFIDVGKEAYPKLVEPSLRLLRKGGLLVADNALWGGDVAKTSRRPGAAAVKAFNKTISGHPDLVSVVLPVRDGLSLSVKV